LKTGHNLPAERVFKDGLGEFDKKNFIAGRNRDYGDAVEYRMHNTIFYKPEKFEVLKQGSFFLSATPDKFSVGWDTMNTKASQMRVYVLIVRTQRLSTNSRIRAYSVYSEQRRVRVR
jgi:hypothetical protein